jgi:hypothetical protein
VPNRVPEKQTEFVAQVRVIFKIVKVDLDLALKFSGFSIKKIGLKVYNMYILGLSVVEKLD